MLKNENFYNKQNLVNPTDNIQTKCLQIENDLEIIKNKPKTSYDK